MFCLVETPRAIRLAQFQYELSTGAGCHRGERRFLRTAALARSCGVGGVRIDRAGDFAGAVGGDCRRKAVMLKLQR